MQVRPRALVLLVALASAVAQAFGRFSYALLLPAIDRDLLGSYAVAGLVATANVTAYLGGTVAVSALSRRARPATLIQAGLACSALGLGLLTRAGSAGGLAVGLTLTGVGGAFIWVPAPGLAGSVVRPSRRGAAIGVAGSGIGGGIVLASALTWTLRSWGGDASWRTVYLVETAIAVVTLVLCLVLLRPARHRDDDAPVRAAALRRVPGWIGLTGGYAAYGLAYSVYTSYLVTALEDDAGFSAGHASAVYTLVGVGLVAGGIVLGPLSDRWGRGPTLVAGYLAMAGAILLVPLGVEPLATVSALGFGLMMSGLPAVIAAHLSDTLTPREFAGAFGRCTLAFGLAQLCGPPLGGWLAETSGGFLVPFLLAGLVAALGAVLSVDVLRATAAGVQDRGTHRRRRGTP
ncbi:putative MFS family arabinose efflux permease [Geodermatophilus normandii]|uniref:Putative MFS family arabinose efflux permease n=1 Tax=Geodermatophilus normandii TaxID=1137989 RepID=A0A317QQE4_9ACTN|nr:MFS transporter [Geodermatophilus normandii]PWW24385.1 putative MFS family arabinose efflux permease [Geodermatophilus normandii]